MHALAAVRMRSATILTPDALYHRKGLMGEGFAFAAWVRLNFPIGFQPPVSRQREIYEHWAEGRRSKWWCWACVDYHENVG